MRYISNSDVDRRAMLDTVGLPSIEALFSDISEEVKSRCRPMGLPAKSEFEVARTLRELADANVVDPSGISLLGGGVYDHYIPSVGRSEFYTAYTPYQPEVSQGTLTAMFEFQTLICELTGMEVANASMYDGATAVAEAALLAERVLGRKQVVVSRGLFPHYRRVLDTYCWAARIAVKELPATQEGRTDLANVPDGASAVIVQTPNAFGTIEDLSQVKERLGEALLVVATHPIALGLLVPPGDSGADVVVGEGQPLGLSASFGGPLLGLFATRERYLRQIPGRIAGLTVDTDGNDGFTMAAQTREQHIRRERATSNICTNSALCALTATVYLATLGAEGLSELARINVAKAHYLADRLAALPGCELVFSGPFFNEFVLRVPHDPERVRQGLASRGILVDDPRWLRYLGIHDGLRFAVTEKRTKEQLDRVVEAVECAS